MVKKILIFVLILSNIAFAEKIELNQNLILDCKFKTNDHPQSWDKVKKHLPSNFATVLGDNNLNSDSAYLKLIKLMNEADNFVQSALDLHYQNDSFKKIEASEKASYGDYSLLPDPKLIPYVEQSIMYLYLADCLKEQFPKKQ